MRKSGLRQELKYKFPSFKYRLKTVSFQDLGREDAIFLESREWTPGMYIAVKEIAARHGVLISC